MAILDIAVAALKNFTGATDSVKKGGAASVVVLAVGAVLVSLGITLPLGIGILSMAEVQSVALIIGPIVTAITKDSQKQAIDQLADHLQVSASHIQSMIPQIQASFPKNENQPTNPKDWSKK